MVLWRTGISATCWKGTTTIKTRDMQKSTMRRLSSTCTLKVADSITTRPCSMRQALSWATISQFPIWCSMFPTPSGAFSFKSVSIPVGSNTTWITMDEFNALCIMPEVPQQRVLSFREHQLMNLLLLR